MLVIRKRQFIALTALLAVGTTGLVTKYDHFMPANTPPELRAPRVEVDVATVISKSISEWQSYSGRLEAVDNVEIRPQVAGTIVAVHIKDGELVRKGDSLFTLDQRIYLAHVDIATGQLAAAESRASHAATDAGRSRLLIEYNATSKREFDEKQNAAREAAANVKTARATLDVAKVNLSHTHITAPIAGRVSRAELTVGNVVYAGANAPLLTTLVSISPIYASFDVDEHTYLRYLNQLSGDAVPVALGLADEDGYSRQGFIASIDNHLDTRSGTVRVRARFDNANGALLPGLYARVKIGAGNSFEAVMVDDAAIGTDQDRKYVLVVGNDSRVHYREVALGNLHEGLRIVTSGLKANERIVVNGLQHVRPNDIVHTNIVKMDDVGHADRHAAYETQE